MDSVDCFWIIKNTTAEWLWERTAASLHDWGTGTLLRIMTGWFEKLCQGHSDQQDINCREMLCVLFFWDIRSWKGEKTKHHWHMDDFSIVHRESNILSKDHIKPIELLREHLAKKRFPSLVKKQHKRCLSYWLNAVTTDHLLHYSKDNNHTQCTLQLPFNYASLSQTVISTYHCISWETIKSLKKTLAYLPLSWKSLKRNWRSVYLKKTKVIHSHQSTLKGLLWEGSSHHAVLASLGFSALFFPRCTSPPRPECPGLKNSLPRLVNLLGPRCARRGWEAQRNTTLTATRSNRAGLSLPVCMAWCLQTIPSSGSDRKSSLTQHGNAPWHRSLQILSIQTSPTFFNTEPSSVPTVPHKPQTTTALFSTGRSKIWGSTDSIL